MILISANGERCGWCSEVAEVIRCRDNRDAEMGDLIVCGDCGAVHEVVEDGMKFTGQRCSKAPPHLEHECVL